MASFLPFLGIWFWWILAAVLLLGELLSPGVFLIWLALAAATVGAVTSVVTLGWQVEALLFAGLAVAYVLVAAPWYTQKLRGNTDRPTLNQRIYAFVGKIYVLKQPIVDGAGKLDIDGTRWDIIGADQAVGTTVRVVAVEGIRLRVEPVS
jgi:membrane protein implicated in regulation of membrane protease activity